jgi:hypothetical protein
MIPTVAVRTPTALLVGALILLASLVALGRADTARAAEATCPSTFHVLHDDRIGRLSLPEGHYQITLLDSARLSCSAASDLFRQFLEDYDGKLRKPWVVIPSEAEFRAGESNIGFRVRRVGGGGGGGGGGHHPANGTACPGFFHVLHNDRIGRLSLPEGEYRITLLAVGRLSCARASQLFTRFLQDWDGNLPGRWRVHPATGTFSKNPHVGFRVKRAVGEEPNPSAGGVHPAAGQRCAASFRVLHNDRIGQLRLPAGSYSITLLQNRGLSCQRASQLFARFLQDFEGNLPGRWRVNPESASFTQGRGGKGFRVKLLR